MNKELLQSAKDQAARENGYENFYEYQCEIFSTSNVLDRAMEIYAEKVGQAQWNAAIEKAADVGVRECRGYYEHEIYTSILKLKK